ncbi:MAG TPA: hypothetical protein VIH58_00100, partial [Chthoniobacterales bacterium]
LSEIEYGVPGRDLSRDPKAALGDRQRQKLFFNHPYFLRSIPFSPTLDTFFRRSILSGWKWLLLYKP